MTDLTLERFDSETNTYNKIQIKVNESDFIIAEDNVDGELCKSGALIRYYSDLASELSIQYNRKKERREFIYAELALDLRKEFEEKGKKVTENIIKENIQVSFEYQNATIELLESERDFKKADGYYKAQQKKSECLRSLAYKQAYEIAKHSF